METLSAIFHNSLNNSRDDLGFGMRPIGKSTGTMRIYLRIFNREVTQSRRSGKDVARQRKFRYPKHMPSCGAIIKCDSKIKLSGAISDEIIFILRDFFDLAVMFFSNAFYHNGKYWGRIIINSVSVHSPLPWSSHSALPQIFMARGRRMRR